MKKGSWITVIILSILLLMVLGSFLNQYLQKKNYENFRNLISVQQEPKQYDAFYKYSFISVTNIVNSQVNYSVENGEVIYHNGKISENFLYKDHDCNSSFDKQKNISVCECTSKTINCSSLEIPSFKGIVSSAGSVSGEFHKWKECYSGNFKDPFTNYETKFQVCFKNNELVSYEFSYKLPGRGVGQIESKSWKRIS